MTKIGLNNDMTNHTGSMSKAKLNYQNLSNRVQSVAKTRQDNDMVDCTSAIYAEKETELSYLIGSCVICDENHIRQR